MPFVPRARLDSCKRAGERDGNGQAVESAGLRADSEQIAGGRSDLDVIAMEGNALMGVLRLCVRKETTKPH